MITHRKALIVVSAAVFVLSGCNRGAGAPQPTPPSPADASTGLPVPGSVPSATHGGVITHDDGRETTPRPTASTLDVRDRGAAVSTGTQAMRLFARRNVSAQRWWEDLSPLMTPQAQQAYRYVDPRNIPPTRVTGPARLTPASTPTVARVSVPTNAGVYLVILARLEDDQRWRVDRFLPPENLGEA